ncbi:hypothetical protein KD923_11265 [Escherichia fergusonii]|nr:hypothetical protein [Escherichia fergusonii]MCH5360765.1 hypothetical protein [Escherichia fergusonii]
MLRRLFTIIVILSATGCSIVDTSLEKKDILNLSVYENYIVDNSVLIIIVADHGNSALVVREIEQRRAASSTINIHIYLSLPMFADKESSSDIYYTLIVPPDIDKLTIGDDEQIVWTRAKK